MTGRILIIDPVVTGRITLKVKLASAFYTVEQAATVADALKLLREQELDLILVESDRPDGGANTVRAAAAEADVICVALLSEGRVQQRAAHLAAGFHDVICRPFHEVTLLARVRHLLRQRRHHDKSLIQADTRAALGLADAPTRFDTKLSGAVVGRSPREARIWSIALSKDRSNLFRPLTPKEMVAALAGPSAPDGVVISVDPENLREQLDLISALKTAGGRHTTNLLAVIDPLHPELASLTLDAGADDIMVDGFDVDEAHLRLHRLRDASAQTAWLERSVKAGLEAAITDPLTGLYNRRYALPQINRIADDCQQRTGSMALMLLDLDHFKRVNDQFGHAVGDAVLRDFASLLRSAVRPIDLVARIGGEEFLVVLPDAGLDVATAIGERIRRRTKRQTFATDLVTGGIRVSVSVGLAISGRPHQFELSLHDLGSQLLQCADTALYSAKEHGRDKVHVHRSAA